MSETPSWGDPNADQPNTPPPPPPSPYGAAPQAGAQGPGSSQYGAPQYGTPPYGAPQYGAAPANHPQSTTILVLGILGLVVCSVLAPIAWVMGNRAVAEIDASNGTLGGRSNANIGRILGIIGTVLLVLGVLVFLLVVIGAFATGV